MKLQPTEYNPFFAIVRAREEDPLYSPDFINFVLSELNKGGITFEEEKEIDVVLNLLTEMEII